MSRPNDSRDDVIGSYARDVKYNIYWEGGIVITYKVGIKRDITISSGKNAVSLFLKRGINGIYKKGVSSYFSA